MMMAVDPWFLNKTGRTAQEVKGRAVLGIREIPDLDFGIVNALS